MKAGDRGEFRPVNTGADRREVTELAVEVLGRLGQVSGLGLGGPFIAEAVDYDKVAGIVGRELQSLMDGFVAWRGGGALPLGVKIYPDGVQQFSAKVKGELARQVVVAGESVVVMDLVAVTDGGNQRIWAEVRRQIDMTSKEVVDVEVIVYRGEVADDFRQRDLLPAVVCREPGSYRVRPGLVVS